MKAILIAGPTGIGKSKLVNLLENEINSVVINADAMQVYTSLRIITARPPDNPNYYLYGHVEDNVSYSVGNWLEDVAHIIEELSKNNPDKVLIFVGGTGLYFNALINGISYIPDVAPEIKIKSSELFREHGIKYFLNVLEKFDQITFSSIDKSNPRRVLRAWEVLKATGKPISHFHQNRMPSLISAKESVKCVLKLKKPTLDHLNAERFRRMLSAGAIEECELARRNGMGPLSLSFKAIGVSEIAKFLDGVVKLEDSEKKAVIRTRQYSKRQVTWFRNNFSDWNCYNLDELNHSQISKKIITSIGKL